MKQRVIAHIENGFSASEAGQRCHVPRGQRRGRLVYFKIIGSVKGAILQGARVVRQGKRTEPFSEFMKRIRSALRTR